MKLSACLLLLVLASCADSGANRCYIISETQETEEAVVEEVHKR